MRRACDASAGAMVVSALGSSWSDAPCLLYKCRRGRDGCERIRAVVLSGSGAAGFGTIRKDRGRRAYRVRMGIIGWIVVGLVAGGLARWIVKDDRSGCIYTMIVGVIGALIGGGLMSLIDESGVDEFSFRSIVVAVIGAVLLLLVLQAIAGRRRSGFRR